MWLPLSTPQRDDVSVFPQVCRINKCVSMIGYWPYCDFYSQGTVKSSLPVGTCSQKIPSIDRVHDI